MVVVRKGREQIVLVKPVIFIHKAIATPSLSIKLQAGAFVLTDNDKPAPPMSGHAQPTDHHHTARS